MKTVLNYDALSDDSVDFRWQLKFHHLCWRSESVRRGGHVTADPSGSPSPGDNVVQRLSRAAANNSVAVYCPVEPTVEVSTTRLDRTALWRVSRSPDPGWPASRLTDHNHNTVAMTTDDLENLSRAEPEQCDNLASESGKRALHAGVKIATVRSR